MRNPIQLDPSSDFGILSTLLYPNNITINQKGTGMQFYDSAQRKC